MRSFASRPISHRLQSDATGQAGRFLAPTVKLAPALKRISRAALAPSARASNLHPKATFELTIVTIRVPVRRLIRHHLVSQIRCTERPGYREFLRTRHYTLKSNTF